jgi:hypothetical protein
VAKELAMELAALPAKFGFANVADFAAAVATAAGGKPAGQVAAEPPATGKKRRKRAKITAETKAEVKKLVAAGKTGSAIAKAVGISLPSVQNIKKELGLVKQPGKAPAPAPEAKPKAAKPPAPATQKRRKQAKQKM